MKKTFKDPVCGLPIVIDCSTVAEFRDEVCRRHIGIDCDDLDGNSGYCWTLGRREGGGTRILVWINKDTWTVVHGPGTIAHECFHALMFINSMIYGTNELKLDSDQHEYAAYHLGNLYDMVWSVVARTIGKEKS